MKFNQLILLLIANFSIRTDGVHLLSLFITPSEESEADKINRPANSYQNERANKRIGKRRLKDKTSQPPSHFPTMDPTKKTRRKKSDKNSTEGAPIAFPSVSPTRIRTSPPTEGDKPEAESSPPVVDLTPIQTLSPTKSPTPPPTEEDKPEAESSSPVVDPTPIQTLSPTKSPTPPQTEEDKPEAESSPPVVHLTPRSTPSPTSLSTSSPTQGTTPSATEGDATETGTSFPTASPTPLLTTKNPTPQPTLSTTETPEEETLFPAPHNETLVPLPCSDEDNATIMCGTMSPVPTFSSLKPDRKSTPSLSSPPTNVQTFAPEDDEMLIAMCPETNFENAINTVISYRYSLETTTEDFLRVEENLKGHMFDALAINTCRSHRDLVEMESAAMDTRSGFCIPEVSDDNICTDYNGAIIAKVNDGGDNSNVEKISNSIMTSLNDYAENQDFSEVDNNIVGMKILAVRPGNKDLPSLAGLRETVNEGKRNDTVMTTASTLAAAIVLQLLFLQ